MSLKPILIELETIVPPISVKRSQFEESQIEKFANLLLRADDTVKPIILHKISPVSYEVLEGYFEYYSAIKAQEINFHFTSIRAYVVPPELESTFLEQYQFLRSLSLPDSTEKDLSKSIEKTTEPITEVSPQPQSLEHLEQAIANRLEQKLNTIIDSKIAAQITSNFQPIDDQLAQKLSEAIEQKIKEPIDSSLEVILNQLKIIKEIITPPSPKDIINDLNTMDIASLEDSLAKSGKGNSKFARPIYELRLQRPNQKFASTDDVWKNIKGLGEKTMQKIIEKW